MPEMAAFASGADRPIAGMHSCLSVRSLSSVIGKSGAPSKGLFTQQSEPRWVAAVCSSPRRIKSNSEVGPAQLVSLAAGLCPLGFDIARDTGEKVTNIYEVDTASLEDKAKIIDKLDPVAARKIHYVRSDIRDPKIVSLLEDYDRKLPTVVVFEGISYYVSMDDLAVALSPFKTRDKSNFIVFDFGVPFDSLAEKVLPRALLAAKHIEDRYFSPGMFRIGQVAGVPTR